MDQGTSILLDALKEFPFTGDVLDMGCGYGVIGIVLAKTHPNIHVTACDINARAVELTKINAEKNQVSLEVKESNGFESIPGKYDAILMNPPIRTGKENVYQLFDGAYQHLKQDGKFFCVIRKQQGAPSAQKKLLELYQNCEIQAKSKGYWVLECTRKETN